jgi:hypothetical protein
MGGILEDEETEELGNHIEMCGYCTERRQLLYKFEDVDEISNIDPEEVLKRVEAGLDAHECPLTEHLQRFWDRGEELEEHTEHCEACQRRWRVIEALSVERETDEPCPPPEDFGDMSVDKLDREKVMHILSHSISCWWCTQKLREIAKENQVNLPTLEELLEQAEKS